MLISHKVVSGLGYITVSWIATKLSFHNRDPGSANTLVMPAFIQDLKGHINEQIPVNRTQIEKLGNYSPVDPS